jgi:hypothetical protein
MGMDNASSTLDLTDEFKARNAPAAAAKLANLRGDELVRELTHPMWRASGSATASTTAKPWAA